MSLRTRRPTGVVPYPVVLLEGEEKAGKSYAAALLSASDKVGDTYWIDLGEGAADEYGAIPGTRYVVVEHDGSYAQILAAVEGVKAVAADAKEAGKPPVVLVIDSMSALWDGLKDWATERAKKQKANREKLAQDPAAEVNVSMNLWNDAGARYRRVMTLLLTFPGIVVITARGKEVAELREGRPVEGHKVWKVEGHKTLAFDATLWLRMSRTQPPLVVGARSVHVGLVPGRDDPQPVTLDTPNLLEWLIFDVLKVDAARADVRDLQPVHGGDLTDDERAELPTNEVEPTEAEKRQRRVVPRTDKAWLEEWQKRLEECADEETRLALETEAREKYEAGKLGAYDKTNVLARLADKAKALQVAA